MRRTRWNFSLDDFRQLIIDTYHNWRNDRTLRLGAGLAYYVVFSLVPMIAISIVIASMLFPREEVVGFVQDKAAEILGSDVTEVQNYISQTAISETVGEGFFSLGIAGVIGLVIGASFALLALQDVVNMIWGKPVVKGWRNLLRKYIFSYIMVLGVALILVGALVVQAMINFANELLAWDGPVIDFMSSASSTIATWFLFVFALTWLIRVLTTQRVSWLNAFIGSTVTVIFMYLGVIAIGWYLNNFSLRSVTSAFSAVMFILVWVYYESQILLAGFQLTKTLSQSKKP